MLAHIVFVLMSLAYVSGAEIPEFIKKDVERVRTACVAEVGVVEQNIDNCNDGIFAEDRALKCYIDCLYEKFDLLRPDGSIDTEKVVNFFPDDIRPPYEALIRACADIPGADSCEIAFNTQKCYYATSPDLHFMI